MCVVSNVVILLSYVSQDNRIHKHEITLYGASMGLLLCVRAIVRKCVLVLCCNSETTDRLRVYVCVFIDNCDNGWFAFRVLPNVEYNVVVCGSVHVRKQQQTPTVF